MKMKVFLSGFCLSAALLIIPSAKAQFYISTIAGGNGLGAYTGDNGPADSAQLNGPNAICMDAAGNMYIADANNNVIRKIDAITHIITTVAGNGVSGYTGDGGLATSDSATLNNPLGVAVDKYGNIYIADEENNVVREVIDTSGVIITIAGTGTGGYNGDNINARNAQLNLPLCVALDDTGNIYIGDSYNNLVRKIEASSNIITTYAGTYDQAGYSGDGQPANMALIGAPNALWIDAQNNVYIADDNSTVRKVDAQTYLISTVAGNSISGDTGNNGPADSAEINSPTGVCTDSAGNLYIGDTQNNKVKLVNHQTNTITTIAGTGQYGFYGDYGLADTSELNNPTGLWIDGQGNVYIADNYNNAIRKLTYARPSAIDAPKPDISVAVYPNPSKGTFMLQFSGYVDGAQLQVYNILGEKVYQTGVDGPNMRVNLSAEAPGIYFFKLLEGSSSYIQKGVLAR